MIDSTPADGRTVAADQGTPILDQHGQPRVVWRGETSGEMFDTFDLARTMHGSGFFFAENRDHAVLYAKDGTEPRAFELRAQRVLDLTDPYARSVRAFCDALRAEFDEWTDRYSGEPMALEDFLESGALYDYEGTGSGGRWHRLFRMAWAEGYDAVAVLDATDGVPLSTVWVVAQPEQIRPAAISTQAPAAAQERRRMRARGG